MFSTLSIAILLLGLIATSRSQELCDGVWNSSAPPGSGILVDGGDCTLAGVTVPGDVRIENGGRLTTGGETVIEGIIMGTDSGNVNLDGALTVGTVTISGVNTTTTVRVGTQAVVGGVTVRSVKKFMGRGNMSSVTAVNTGTVVLQGGKILGGGLTNTGGTKITALCGASVSGGVTLDGANGDFLAVAGPSCPWNDLSGPLSVTNGQGSIKIVGNRIRGMNVMVSDQVGDTLIAMAQLGDILFERNTGSIKLNGVTANSGANIGPHEGEVKIMNSRFEGDFGIRGSDMVTLDRNDFNMGAVNVMNNAGPVTMTANTNFSTSVGTNAGVVFTHNRVSAASFSGNTNGTTISANYIGTLSCTENVPAPTAGMTANIISDGATGQCETF